MIDLSISLVSFNTRDLLRQCINSIVKSTHTISYEIIVVDNNSADNSAIMVEEEFPAITLVKNKENVFFACAHNQAIRLAKGEYICMLNPDTIILENTFEILLNKIKSNAEIGAIGCKLLSEKNEIQETVYKKSTLANFLSFSRYLSVFVKPFLPNRMYPSAIYEKEGYVELMQNSLMILRRSFLISRNLFDENIKLYCTEDQIAEELEAVGQKMFYTPEVSSIHFLGRSTKPESNPFFIYKINRDDYYFFYKKYKGTIQAAVVYFFLSIDLVLIRLAQLIKRYSKHEKKP